MRVFLLFLSVSLFLPFQAAGVENIAQNGFLAAGELGAGESALHIKDDERYKKEFTIWPSYKVGIGYRYAAQTFRFSYAYGKYDSGISVDAWMLGYRYEFTSLPIVRNDAMAILPMLSFDFGLIRLREQNIDGWGGEIGAGFSCYLSHRFALLLLYARGIAFWEGRRDEASIRQLDERTLRFGLEYRFGSFE